MTDQPVQTDIEDVIEQKAQENWAVFDTETTGLVNAASTDLKAQPYVIEFAGVIINPTGDVIHEYESLFKPPIPIPEIITKITGITDAKLEGAGVFDAGAVSEFFKHSGASACVAHNVTFDRAMLSFEFARADRSLELPRALCTVEATSYVYGRRMKLAQLYRWLFNEDFVGAHRAMNDVKALARCVAELRKREILR